MYLALNTIVIFPRANQYPNFLKTHLFIYLLIYLFVLTIFNPQARMFFLIFEREEGGEKERETSIGCLLHVPQMGIQGLNLHHFWCADTTPCSNLTTYTCILKSRCLIWLVLEFSQIKLYTCICFWFI